MTPPKRGTVPIDSIVEDFFVRTRLNDDHVLHLASLYEANMDLPPIKVTRTTSRVVDGRHRLAARKLIEKKSIDVEWTDESNTGVLISEALVANIGGSLPPNNADITYAMQQMITAGMPKSGIQKRFAEFWPPSVVKRFIDNAVSNLNKTNIIHAKAAIVEKGMTVGEAALAFGVNLETLKASIAGTRRRKSNINEINSGLTTIFRSRGGSMAQLMRRVQRQFEDGELAWGSIEKVLDHLDSLCKSTAGAARDWRNRLEKMNK